MSKRGDYPVVVEPLSEEDGGGYLAFFPDLPGCMSDGETREEALANAQDAFESWMEVQQERGALIPAPGEGRIERITQILDGLADTIVRLEERVDEVSGRVSALEDAGRASALERTAALEAALTTGSWARKGTSGRIRVPSFKYSIKPKAATN